jgi:hypothetical protein
MSYILYIWTAVAMAGDRHYQTKAMDWRPIGEYHNTNTSGHNAQEKCEEAARQLGLKPENYRCVRNK